MPSFCPRASSIIAASLLAGGLFGAQAAEAQPATPVPYDAERGVFSFADQIERALPAVVRVTTLNRSSGPTSTPAEPGREVAGGSGVIIDAEAGILVTNQHVIADGNEYRVDLLDGRSFDAELVGADDASDIAVLRIDAPRLTQVDVIDSDTLRIGDLVFAVGHPLGLDQTLTLGIVSGLGRSGMGDSIEDFIQTDAAVNSGNSGGPLLDSSGRLIGINTAILSGSVGGGNDGVAFAVPTRIMLAVVSQLRQYGEVRRGRIGVTLGSLTPGRARELGVSTTRGAVVEAVVPGSPAEQAGLLPNDIIIRIQGRRVQSSGAVTSTVGIAEPGHNLDLVYLRGEAEHETRLIVEEPVAVEVASTSVGTQAFGAGFRDLRANERQGDDVQGVMVTYVEPGSVAARAGLSAGDIVIQVNAAEVTSTNDLASLFEDSPTGAQIQVVRGEETLPILLRP